MFLKIVNLYCFIISFKVYFIYFVMSMIIIVFYLSILPIFLYIVKSFSIFNQLSSHL